MPERRGSELDRSGGVGGAPPLRSLCRHCTPLSPTLQHISPRRGPIFPPRALASLCRAENRQVAGGRSQVAEPVDRLQLGPCTLCCSGASVAARDLAAQMGELPPLRSAAASAAATRRSTEGTSRSATT